VIAVAQLLSVMLCDTSAGESVRSTLYSMLPVKEATNRAVPSSLMASELGLLISTMSDFRPLLRSISAMLSPVRLVAYSFVPSGCTTTSYTVWPAAPPVKL